VPLLIGLDPATALFTAGIGTLIFHLITKGIVPIFLGSSFAFIEMVLIILAVFVYRIRSKNRDLHSKSEA